MTTVDSHTHIIAADRVRYPTSASGGVAADQLGQLPVSAEGLLGEMQRAGIDRALFVQPNGVYGTDNSYVADSARQHACRASGVCIIDVLAPDAIETLRSLVRDGGLRGIRLFQTGEAPDAPWIEDARVLAVWGCARELRIPVLVFVRSNNLGRLRPVLERYSDVPVAFDNLSAFVTGEEPELVPPALLALSELPNVYCKLSTVNLYRAEASGRPVADSLSPLFERFGARRVMWGSNYPVTRDRSYSEMVEYARSALSFLSHADREWVFGASALRLWPELA